MLKNPFSLDLYRVNTCESEFGQYIKIKDKKDSLWLDKNIDKKILPSINLNNSNFIIGDIFFNKKNKELIVFSFLTSIGLNGKHSVTKLGFLKFKDINIAINNYRFLHSLKKDSFIKFNEIEKLEDYIKFGNLFLEKNTSKVLFESYDDTSFNLEEYNSFIKNVEGYLKSVNNINLSLFYKDKMISSQLDDISQDIFLSLDFSWQPRLCFLLKSKQDIKEINGIQYNIYCIKDEFKRKTNIHKFLFYFDINSFETKLMLPDKNIKNLDYLLKSSSLNYYELRLNDENYNESFLYFL